MPAVSSSEFAKNFGRYREAAQSEPVVVTNHERVTGVFLSPQAYEEYQRLRALATRALYVEELSAETLKAVADSRMDPRHDHLNALMADE